MIPRRKPATQSGTIQRNDLLRLGEGKLVELLAEQISTPPYHEQKRWARRHLPERPKGQSASASRPAALLNEIEAFCAQSRSGAFVSWEDDRGWYDEYDLSDDGEEFEEWVALFSDLMKGALELTRSDRHTEAAKAYRMLLELLREAGETTDILGNHGAPEDSIPLDFGNVIEAYTRSLLASRSSGSVDEVPAARGSAPQLRQALASHADCPLLWDRSRALPVAGRAGVVGGSPAAPQAGLREEAAHLGKTQS